MERNAGSDHSVRAGKEARGSGRSPRGNRPSRRGFATPSQPAYGWEPLSAIEDIAWPAVLASEAAQLLALQFQLDRSELWPSQVLEGHQFRQLERLVDHAYRTVPFHRGRLAAAGYRSGQSVTPEFWRSLPILTRRDAQKAGASLASANAPPSHGSIFHVTTSGSTGIPVKVSKTGLDQLFWLAITLREERWHRRDLRLTLAVIRGAEPGRGVYPSGSHFDDWGQPMGPVYHTGPCFLLDIRTLLSEQVNWLIRIQPNYLLTFPSNALALAIHFKERRLKMPSLRAVRTLSEVLDPETRRVCREVWGVEIVDMYSSAETGYIALQCPEHPYYHVQSETALVEVLDSTGRACGPGEIGRVIVTPLHNFAMPLLRYDVGDYAEVGGRCSCGRGLPVIRRILGRAKHSLTLPSGSKRHAWLGTQQFAEIGPIIQHQVVQRTLEDLEVRLVVQRPLTAVEEDRIRRILAQNLGYEFRIEFRYYAEIPRAPSGKFFEFLSELET
jgi:phenylacetate-CoA ligase